jgi:16S rRNA (guanine527-N7)-methyltransferase
VNVPEPESDIVAEAAAYGVPLEGRVRALSSAFLGALLETNRAFNLTAVTEPGQTWRKHILDSLSLAPSLAARPELTRILDVGSGGGLPALPLAIALPERQFTLLEATGKKARFLSETARALGLENVSVICERAETFGQEAEGRARFDAVTSRAVSRLSVLLELTLPFVRVGGLALALKGERAELEIQEAERALKVLGGTVSGVERTSTGTIVRIAKTALTPAKYPRRPGEPKRTPL